MDRGLERNSLLNDSTFLPAELGSSKPIFQTTSDILEGVFPQPCSSYCELIERFKCARHKNFHFVFRRLDMCNKWVETWIFLRKKFTCFLTVKTCQFRLPMGLCERKRKYFNQKKKEIFKIFKQFLILQLFITHTFFVNIHFKQPRRWGCQERHKFIYLTMRNSSFAHLAREFLFLFIPEPYILLLCSCMEFLIFRINLVTVQTNFPWTRLRIIKNGLHSRRVSFSDGHAVVDVSLLQLPHKLPIPL